MDIRRHDVSQRLERPELSIFRTNRTATNRTVYRFRRPFRTLTNPLDEPGHFVGPQWLVGGHFQLARSPGRLNEQAVIGIAGDNRRPTVAPLAGQSPRVEPQPGFLLGGAVALDAACVQKRANAALEQRSLATVRRHRRR